MKVKALFLVWLISPLGVFWAGAQEQVVKDDLGYPFQILRPPQRIISLAPNITEILFALGLGEKIVGVTRYCDFPPEALKKAKIGGMVDPNLEMIKSLNPDLVISFRGNPLRTLTRLRDLGFSVFILEQGRDLESLFLMIEKIGLVAQANEKAGILVSSLREKSRKIEDALRPVASQPRVFLSLHGLGLWTCGKESYLNDLVHKAKGINVTGSLPKKWIYYNREQLVHDNPDVIIILAKSQADFATAKTWFRKEANLDDVEAVRKDTIRFLDENTASRYGPRLVDAFGMIARLLHPQAFGDKQ
jgi:iron complex transport system substrate-binding protein